IGGWMHSAASSEQTSVATLAQGLDLRDVLTDEPRDIRRMGRDHEMTRAGNGHHRRSGDCVTQHLGDAPNSWMTALASHEEAWRGDASVGGKRHIGRPTRQPVEKVRRRGGNDVVPGPGWKRIEAAVAAIEVDHAP